MWLISTVRDLREFLEAKRRKREPIVWNVKGAACATLVPPDRLTFTTHMAQLAMGHDFGRACERFTRLCAELRRRHAVGVPLPRKVMQNSDRSLSFFWEGISVQCREDGFVSCIGGTAGMVATKITRELLDALAFQVRIQMNSN